MNANRIQTKNHDLLNFLGTKQLFWLKFAAKKYWRKIPKNCWRPGFARTLLCQEGTPSRSQSLSSQVYNHGCATTVRLFTYIITGPPTHTVGGQYYLLSGVYWRRLSSSITLHGGTYAT